MQIPPAAVLEAWPKPNYTDPYTRGNANLIVNLTLFPLALIFLLLRVYTRLKISKSFGLDDVFIVVAIIPTTGFFILGLLVDLHWNIFRHTWDIPSPELSIQLKTNLVAECLFGLAFPLTKLSILQLLRRILERSTSRTRLIVLIAMGLIVAEGFVFLFTIIFQCSPISAYWAISIDPQNCLNERNNLLAADILNTITDSLVVLLPIFLISNLNLPVRQLLVVSGLFALGFIVVVAGIFRTIMFYHLDSVFDKTWVAYYVWLASEIELYTGVLCTSILPTQPLFMNMFPTAYTRLFLSPKSTFINTETNTYRASIITPPHPLRISTPLFSNRKHLPSCITVEDEISISYENWKKPPPRNGKHQKDSMDLESRLCGPQMSCSKKLGTGAGKKDAPANPNTAKKKNHVRPGRDSQYLKSPDPTLQQIVSRRIQYLKAPQPKVVRISLDNPRIRTITPDSEWNTSRSDIRCSSLSSVSNFAPSALNFDTGKKKFNRGGAKSENEVGRRDTINTVSSSDSAITNGSGIIGIGVIMAPLPPLPPQLRAQRSLNNLNNSSQEIASRRNGKLHRRSKSSEALNWSHRPTPDPFASRIGKLNRRSKSIEALPWSHTSTSDPFLQKQQHQTSGNSPKRFVPKNATANPSREEDLSPGFGPKKRHIADFMDESVRGGSMDTARSTKADTTRSSELSSLSAKHRLAIQQAGLPRRDSPTLSRDTRLAIQSLRRGLL